MSQKISALLEIMARLRNPDGGCPWDVEQDFASIAPHTIEEAYEVADAIEKNDMAGLKSELGDLLFQVVFHAQMAKEAGEFDFDDVADAISKKMIDRHPHVFGDADIATAEAQTLAWEDMKTAERAASGADDDESALAGVTVGLPALSRAQKMQKRAARVGFDWRHAKEVVAKVCEEVAELEWELESGANSRRLEDEIGDLLFSCVNLARALDIDAETALRRGTDKFERRFRAVEGFLAEDGKSPAQSNLDEMESLWRRAKAAERFGKSPSGNDDAP